MSRIEIEVVGDQGDFRLRVQVYRRTFLSETAYTRKSAAEDAARAVGADLKALPIVIVTRK